MIYGGFHIDGGPPKWMGWEVENGESYSNGWFGGTPILGFQPLSNIWKSMKVSWDDEIPNFWKTSNIDVPKHQPDENSWGNMLWTKSTFDKSFLWETIAFPIIFEVNLLAKKIPKESMLLIVKCKPLSSVQDYWLVVGPPLWKILVNWYDYSPYMGK